MDHTGDLDAAVAEFSHAVDDLERLHDKGLVFDSHLVESLQPALTDLRALQDVTEPQLHDTIANLLVRHWSRYVTTQARLMPNGKLAERPADQLLEQLASGTAAYDPLLGAILESSPALAFGISGFRQEHSLDLAEAIQRNVLIRRELIYEREHDWAPFRQAMIDHTRLLLMRSQCNIDKIQYAELISKVLETAQRIVYHELDQYKIEHPEELPRSYDPEDKILLLVVQYLEGSAKNGVSDRESGGLKRDILYLMAKFERCIERRFRSCVWSTEFPRQRDVLSRALDSSGFRSHNRDHSLG